MKEVFSSPNMALELSIMACLLERFSVSTISLQERTVWSVAIKYFSEIKNVASPDSSQVNYFC